MRRAPPSQCCIPCWRRHRWRSSQGCRWRWHAHPRQRTGRSSRLSPCILPPCSRSRRPPHRCQAPSSSRPWLWRPCPPRCSSCPLATAWAEATCPMRGLRAGRGVVLAYGNGFGAGGGVVACQWRQTLPECPNACVVRAPSMATDFVPEAVLFLPSAKDFVPEAVLSLIATLVQRIFGAGSSVVLAKRERLRAGGGVVLADGNGLRTRSRVVLARSEGLRAGGGVVLSRSLGFRARRRVVIADNPCRAVLSAKVPEAVLSTPMATTCCRTQCCLLPISMRTACRRRCCDRL